MDEREVFGLEVCGCKVMGNDVELVNNDSRTGQGQGPEAGTVQEQKGRVGIVYIIIEKE